MPPLPPPASGMPPARSSPVFGYGTDDDGDVIISKTLADANDLSVGGTFKVADITDDTKTYTLTIVGI